MMAVGTKDVKKLQVLIPLLTHMIRVLWDTGKALREYRGLEAEGTFMVSLFLSV